MKRIWICTLILLALAVGAAVNTVFLGRVTEEIVLLLEEAQSRAEAGDWAEARALTARAEEQWEAHSRYLCIILRHSDVDEAEAGLREVIELLHWDETPEYTAANAALIARVRRLAETERLTADNVL